MLNTANIRLDCEQGWSGLVPSATLIIHFLRGRIICVAGILNGPAITVVLFVFGGGETCHYSTTVSSEAPASRTVLPTTLGSVSVSALGLEGERSGTQLSQTLYNRTYLCNVMIMTRSCVFT